MICVHFLTLAFLKSEENFRQKDLGWGRQDVGSTAEHMRSLRIRITGQAKVAKRQELGERRGGGGGRISSHPGLIVSFSLPLKPLGQGLVAGHHGSTALRACRSLFSAASAR